MVEISSFAMKISVELRKGLECIYVHDVKKITNVGSCISNIVKL